MMNEKSIFEYISCNYCNCQQTELVYKKKGHYTGNEFHIVKCKRCGLMFVNPRLRYEDSRKFYNEDYFAKEIKSSKNNNGYCYQKIANSELYLNEISIVKRFEKGQKLLDVGSGSGLFLERAMIRGYSVVGIEQSDYAYKFSKGRGLDVIKGDVSSVDFPEKTFDIITAFEFIEHCYDPSAFFQKVFYMLKSNGIFYYSTGNFALSEYKKQGSKHYYIMPDEHIYYYTPKSLLNFFKKAGFRVLYKDRGHLIIKIFTKLGIFPHPYQRPQNSYKRLLFELINLLYRIRGLSMPIAFKE